MRQTEVVIDVKILNWVEIQEFPYCDQKFFNCSGILNSIQTVYEVDHTSIQIFIRVSNYESAKIKII